ILANLNPTDVAFYRIGSNHGDLAIQNKVTGNTLIFSNEFAASYEGVASVTFGNGTVWQASDIAANSGAASTPTLSGVTGASYTEEGGAVTLAATASVSDPGSATLAGATVKIADGTFAGDNDVLAASTVGTSITASYNAGTETLTL